MLTKATIKFIKSLQVKKYRKQEQCFLVEGAKSVRELVASDFDIVMLAGTADFLSTLEGTVRGEVVEADERGLAGLGEFQTNRDALAIARMKPNPLPTLSPAEYAIALDDIRDPGNLGTIIRTADWYGIRKIFASEQTADFYNPKVISATMGSFTRTQVSYCDLSTCIPALRVPVYGAFLDGQDVHRVAFGRGGVLLIGSESHGISSPLRHIVTEKVAIPRYGKAESLNAAIATAVILDNIRRG